MPLRTRWTGLRFYQRDECEHLFAESGYHIGGATGETQEALPAVAAARQPVMIVGESGTGKEHVAQYLYLHGLAVGNPLVVADCVLMNDKSWEFLLGHYYSPLNDSGNTVHFKRLESLSPERSQTLLAAISETGLAGRVRLLFSCGLRAGEPAPETCKLFAARLGCYPLELPPLRNRSDEIPSLASLYLSRLNVELGKQLSGFEPGAIELLRNDKWLRNDAQLRQLLRTLATAATSSYIRSSAVAEELAKERALHRKIAVVPAAGRSLEQIIRDSAQEAVAANAGNRAAAARQLGISRTTLWRYLGRE